MAFYHMQMQQENIDTGQYQVTVSDRLNNRPIENARVRISYTGVPDSTIEEVATDSSGRTPGCVRFLFWAAKISSTS